MDFKGLFKANVLAIVVSSAFGVGLALSGFGIWALVIQVVSQSACATLMLYLAASWRPSLLFDREAAKELFGYGWKICATGILNVLYMGCLLYTSVISFHQVFYGSVVARCPIASV